MSRLSNESLHVLVPFRIRNVTNTFIWLVSHTTTRGHHPSSIIWRVHIYVLIMIC